MILPVAVYNPVVAFVTDTVGLFIVKRASLQSVQIQSGNVKESIGLQLAILILSYNVNRVINLVALIGILTSVEKDTGPLVLTMGGISDVLV